MQYTAIITALFAASAIAVPTTPTTTKKPEYPPSKPTSHPNPPPSCGSGKKQYCCSSKGLLINALNCLSILDDTSINVGIPIPGLGQKAASTGGDDNYGCAASDKPFCCSSSGIINAGNCISLLDGLDITIG